MKHFKNVKCYREEDNKLKITWESINASEVKIFRLTGNMEELCMVVKDSNEANFKDADTTKRSLYCLRAEGYEHEIVGESLIKFTGIHNCRDLGGIRSNDGRRIKWGMLYRSDSLWGLTENDIKYFRSLNIGTVFDFRLDSEIISHPDSKALGVTYKRKSLLSSKDIGQKDVILKFIINQYSEKDIEKFIINRYKKMIFNNSAIGELIDSLENVDNFPILYHSVMGNDRTGVITAIILSILGVSKKDIIDDYLASNLYRNEINKQIVNMFSLGYSNNIESLVNIVQVNEVFLEAVFDEIIKRYGTMEVYFEKEYGLTKKKRRELKSKILY